MAGRLPVQASWYKRIMGALRALPLIPVHGVASATYKRACLNPAVQRGKKAAQLVISCPVVVVSRPPVII